MSYITTFLGGPLNGFQRSDQQPPQRNLQFALGPTNFGSKEDQAQYHTVHYVAQPVPGTGPSMGGHLQDEYYIAIFMQTETRDEKLTAESGILCAHCGRDPSTGEEVEEVSADVP